MDAIGRGLASHCGASRTSGRKAWGFLLKYEKLVSEISVVLYIQTMVTLKTCRAGG